MKTFIFFFLFGCVYYTIHAQFVPGTDFYIRNQQLCDSINKFKSTGYRKIGSDSIWAATRNPAGDTTFIYRYSIADKTDSSRSYSKIQSDARYQVIGSYLTAEVDPLYTANGATKLLLTADSLVLATAINGKQPTGSYRTTADTSSSVQSTATVGSRNKARDSVAALVSVVSASDALKKLNSDSISLSGYASVFAKNKSRDSVVALIPSNNNQLSNGSNYKINSDSISVSGYSSLYAKNKSRDSVVALIPTNNNQLSNGSNYKVNSDSINSSGFESRGKFKNDSLALFSAIGVKKNIADSNVCATCYVTVNRFYQVRDSILALIPPPISINSAPGRSLNSNYTISTTRPVLVSYTDSCSVTNPLLAGTSSADVWLEYSLNAGVSWIQPASTGNKSGVALTVTIQITNGQKGTVSAIVPANALVRQRSVTTGTATVTIVNQQEATL